MEEADRLSQEVISGEGILAVEGDIFRQAEKPPRGHTSDRGDDAMCNIEPDGEARPAG